MAAKEMFEVLGYKQLGNLKPDEHYICVAYVKDVYEDKQYIYFYGNKETRIYLEDKRGRIYPPIITIEELKAINKQIEELERGDSND